MNMAQPFVAENDGGCRTGTSFPVSGTISMAGDLNPAITFFPKMFSLFLNIRRCPFSPGRGRS